MSTAAAAGVATAFAPATVSNVACGFDVLGFAVATVGDRVTATVTPRPGVVISRIDGAGATITLDPYGNCAGVAAATLLEGAQVEGRGLELAIEKGIAPGSGLGSSAASAVAAVVAANAALGLGLPLPRLLAFALEGERIASGGVLHGDNVAPCLYGGLVAVRSLDPLDIIPIPVPDGLCCALVRPHIEIKTSESRALLGNAIPLSTAVVQWANLAGLIAGLFRGDWDLIARSLEDVVAEPVRGHQVPAFREIKQAALDAGALGASLSGSGPAVFALCRGAESAERVALAMQNALTRVAGIAGDRYVSAVGGPGARLVEDASAG
ncbi:MAG TPA: homoserine kinase [Thermoanaerobaculia bacterium]|jgi:homoserine kinase|nr:homoserine kinase [Thermoanaerobaculia bacterium]